MTFNTLTSPGIYSITSGGYGYLVRNTSYSDVIMVQEAFKLSSTEPIALSRVYANGTWSPWAAWATS